MSFWNILRGHIDVHQMTQKDISIIKSKLKAEGVLIRMLPLLNDPKAVPKSGVEIAKIIHSTPAIQRIGKHTSDYTSFDLMSVGEKVAMHLWAKDEHQAKRIRNQYKASYPGMLFESCVGDYFPPLVTGEYCTAVRLDYQKDWIYPLEIIETERGWNGVLGACIPDETDQKLMIQILLDPVPEHKTRRGHRVYAERTRPPAPNRPPPTRSENYMRLSEAIAHEANLPHFRVEIRVVVFGKNPHLTKVKAGNIAGAFERFSSTIGGNKLIPKAYNMMWRRAVISILNRDINTFSTSWRHRMLMSTEEVGFNFLTVPVGGAKPLKYAKTEKMMVDEDVTKLWVFGEKKKTILVKPVDSTATPPPTKDTIIETQEGQQVQQPPIQTSTTPETTESQPIKR